MPRFHPLKVTNVRKTTRDAVVVTLSSETPELFDFVQGQYLTFKRDFDGEEIRRSYSICSSTHDGLLRVGIKRVEGGAFSTWANSELTVGTTLRAMPPMGNFHLPIAASHQHQYLGFAGGSGITPVLSNLKTILESEPNSRFTLVYANRNINTIMFREELEDLKNQFLGRLSIVHILESDSQDIELFKGRVTRQKCSDLFERWIDIESVSAAFICGPEPMMLDIAASLEEHGLAKDQIRFELFASNKPRANAPKTNDPANTQNEPAAVEAKVALDGTAFHLKFDRQTSILDAALAAGLDAPYACKAGVCSTCKCKVLNGEVEMAANHALDDYEVKAGYVLSCQAFPISDSLDVVFEDH